MLFFFLPRPFQAAHPIRVSRNRSPHLSGDTESSLRDTPFTGPTPVGLRYDRNMSDSPRAVYTPDAPRPAGHYSQAIVHRGVVYVSGQLPIDAASGPRPPEAPLSSVPEQTRRTLENLRAVLLAAGSSPSQILRCTVYVSDVNLWPQVNQAYAEFFSAHGALPPARTVVPCGPLHFGYQVEIDAIAAADEGPESREWE